MKNLKIKKIHRNMSDRVIAGVCSGVAHTYNFNPLWIRIPLFLLVVYWFPWVLIVYFIAAIIIPKENVAFEQIKYKKFYRIKGKNHILGGVCLGLENYFKIDVVLIRILFIAGVFFGGFGPLIYILLWIISPEKKLKEYLTK